MSLPSDSNRAPNNSVAAWLHPFAELRDVNMEVSSEAVSSSHTAPKPARRGRGRPRLSAVRDPSAIERRRAQVRNAQRAFQERKDNAMAMEKQKYTVVLNVLTNLSTEVEELLRVASLAGTLDRDDQVGAQLRRLRDKFDETMSQPPLSTELEHLRDARERRTNRGDPDHIMEVSQKELETTLAPSATPAINWDPIRSNETTLIAPYNYTVTKPLMVERKSIYQIVTERQAAMRNAERQRQ